MRLCTQLRYLDMFGSIKFTNANKVFVLVSSFLIILRTTQKAPISSQHSNYISLNKQIDEFQSNKNNFVNNVIAFPPSEKSSLSITDLSLINSIGSGQGNSSFGDSMDINDNFLNSSLKLFNSSFNSSVNFDASLGAGDLTKIVSNDPKTDNSYEETSPKLWRRPKVSSYQQPLQHINTNISQQKRKAGNCLYDLVSSSKQFKGSVYGPPKSDILSDDV